MSRLEEVSIRRATVDDIEALVELRLAMRQEVDEAKESPPQSLAMANRAYLREKLPSGEFIAFLAEVEGRIVATSGLVLYKRPPTSRNLWGIDGYILNMYTTPDWRRQGIARTLLKATVDAAREMGARVVWLRATDAGRLLYGQFGFKENPRYMELRL